MPLHGWLPQPGHLINMRSRTTSKVAKKETDINGYHKIAENMQEKGTVHISTRSDPAQVNDVIKTRSGHVIKKPDRLTCT